jgi:hypothetical protein
MMRVGASSTEIDNTATVLDEEDECENKSKEDFTKRFSYNF